MKRIKAIVSVLALGVFALAMMGCPVQYAVGSPYISTVNQSIGAAGATPITIDLKAILAAALINKNPSSVTITLTVTSGSAWNLGYSVPITGGGLPAGTNFISTYNPGDPEATSWWTGGYSPTNYVHIGGLISTMSATTTGRVIGVTGGQTVGWAGQGGGLTYNGSVTYPITNNTALSIAPTWYDNGSFTVKAVEISF